MSIVTTTRTIKTLAATAVATLGIAAPAMAEGWGAIAVNPDTGQTGISYSDNARWQAKADALDDCAGYCKVIVWEHNACAAVVHAPGYFFAGLGYSRGAAIGNARGRAGDPYAQTLAWVCR